MTDRIEAHLDFPFPDADRDLPTAPVCSQCGATYRYLRRGFRIVPDGNGGLVGEVAGPRGTFGDSRWKPVEITTNDLEQMFIPTPVGGWPSRTAQLRDVLRSYERMQLVQMLFEPVASPVLRYEKIRAALTSWYKHPSPMRTGCRAYERGAGSTPRTLFDWLRPLLTLMYACGLTYKSIVQTLVSAGFDPSPKIGSIAAVVARHIEIYADSLVKVNHRKLRGSDVLADLHVVGAADLRIDLPEDYGEELAGWLDKMRVAYGEKLRIALETRRV